MCWKKYSPSKSCHNSFFIKLHFSNFNIYNANGEELRFPRQSSTFERKYIGPQKSRKSIEICLSPLSIFCSYVYFPLIKIIQNPRYNVFVMVTAILYFYISSNEEYQCKHWTSQVNISYPLLFICQMTHICFGEESCVFIKVMQFHKYVCLIIR